MRTPRRRPFLLPALPLLLLAAVPGARVHAAGSGGGEVVESAAGVVLPPYFIENRGQFGRDVRFQVRVGGASLHVHDDGWSLGADTPLRLRFESATRADGTSGARSLCGLDPLRARAHFLTGARRDGATRVHELRDVPLYRRVRLEDLREGLDLELFERDGMLEYDLFLEAGVAVEEIAFRLQGADSCTIDARGDLVATAGGRSWTQRRPVTFQVEPDGSRSPLRSRFRQLGPDRFGFELDGRDPERPVVIDPVLVFSQFVGGSGVDVATDVVVDAEGAMYVAGWTKSGDFAGADHRVRGRDVVIFKLVARPLPSTGDAQGAALADSLELEYVTFLGGHSDEEATGIAVDPRGEIFVVGQTRSSDFPTTSQVLRGDRIGGSDGFALRLAADGRSLRWSTYLGGSSDDQATGLVLGANESLLITGTTRSRDFPSASFAYQTELGGGRDAFVVRLDGKGQFLLFSTYLGGSRDEEAAAIAVDARGNTYVTGRTDSPNFPTTPGAYSDKLRTSDAFVTKLGRVGDALVYSTLLGGTGQDEARALVLDESERAWVGGWTMSNDFPTTENALCPEAPGRGDGFAVCLSPSGSHLDYATYVGGEGKDEVLDLVLDAFQQPWLTGRTESADLPLSSDAALERRAGAGDAFLIGLQEQSSLLSYGSYLGGSGDESGLAIAVQPGTESVVVVGSAVDVAPDARGPFSGRKRGPSDALIARFEPTLCVGAAQLRELGAPVGLDLGMTRPRLGKPIEVLVRSGPPVARGFLLFSPGEPRPRTLEDIATLQLDTEKMGVLLRFRTDEHGRWRHTGRLPSDGSLCGTLMTIQAITLDRRLGPLSFGQISQGLELFFGN